MDAHCNATHPDSQSTRARKVIAPDRFFLVKPAPLPSGKCCNRWNRKLGDTSNPRFRPDAPVAPGREKTCPQVDGPRGMPWGRFSEPPACTSPPAPLG
jgi:hypothetical protein